MMTVRPYAKQTSRFRDEELEALPLCNCPSVPPKSFAY